MLYLIGGTPCSGKTTLSKKLSEVLKTQYISTDILRLFMVASLSEYGKYFEIESEKYGLKYINTEDNFLDKLEEAISYLK